MNKTKIDWADMTWNPVTGCLHGCEYCYARKIAERFAGGGYGKENGMFISKYREDAFSKPYELTEPQLAKTKDEWYRDAPYPFGFDPTFHRYRLNEPAKIKAPQNIFVCSMADLFGSWVPDEWIREVFKACEKAPWHNYMFLTKNPKRYGQYSGGRGVPGKSNFWYGSTVTKAGDMFSCIKTHRSNKSHFFVSAEPLMGNMKNNNELRFTDWVIVGAETGNRKGKIVPKKHWIDEIALECKTAGIPIFMKESLKELMGADFIQEFPEGLKQEHKECEE